jgi:SAM-dependent MidA family methyltransferase
MEGLKGLMEAHNVVVPEEANSDILQDLNNRVEELEGKLEEETAAKISISNELFEAQTTNIFAEATKGLAETQIEKLRALSEGLDYDNAEDFDKKLNTLKESYLANKQVVSEEVSDQDPVELDEEVKPLRGEMANYAAAISRTVRK